MFKTTPEAVQSRRKLQVQSSIDCLMSFDQPAEESKDGMRNLRNRISPHHVRRESEDRRERALDEKFNSPEKQADLRRSNTPENTSWYIEMTLQLYARSEVVEINSRKHSISPFDLSAST